MKPENKKISVMIAATMPNGSFAIFESELMQKSFVCPGWIEVPFGTKFEDIEIIGAKVPVKSERKTYQVKGSTGKTYEVVIDNAMGNSCSCVGFMYYRSCKHLKSIIK